MQIRVLGDHVCTKTSVDDLSGQLCGIGLHGWWPGTAEHLVRARALCVLSLHFCLCVFTVMAFWSVEVEFCLCFCVYDTRPGAFSSSSLEGFPWFLTWRTCGPWMFVEYFNSSLQDTGLLALARGFIVHGRSCQIQSCCFIPLAIDGSLLSFRHFSFHWLPIFVLCTRVT